MPYGNELVLGTATRGLELAAAITLGEDRKYGVHLVGASGTGKSSIVFGMTQHDLQHGHGFALLDPHGDLALKVIDSCPPERSNDVLYFDPSDPTHAVGLNVVNQPDPTRRPLQAAQIVAAFAKIWDTSIDKAPRMTLILLQAVRVLLDAPGVTLVSLPRLLVDAEFRSSLLRTCRDPMIRQFWDLFEKDTDRLKSEAVGPVNTRVSYLLSDPALRRVLGQRRSTLDLAGIMNGSKGSNFLVANLAAGRLGEGPAYLIGALLISSIGQAAAGRAAMPGPDTRQWCSGRARGSPRSAGSSDPRL